MEMRMEPNYEQDKNVLEKFGRDICQSVRDGKIDPVIGRDEEIRKVIQVLARKTKNNECGEETNPSRFFIGRK